MRQKGGMKEVKEVKKMEEVKEAEEVKGEGNRGRKGAPHRKIGEIWRKHRYLIFHELVDKTLSKSHFFRQSSIRQVQQLFELWFDLNDKNTE